MEVNDEKLSIESHEYVQNVAYGYVYAVKTVLESEIITLTLTQNYDSNISWQRLNSFKTLIILSIIWSSASLIELFAE